MYQSLPFHLDEMMNYDVSELNNYTVGTSSQFIVL